MSDDVIQLDDELDTDCWRLFANCLGTDPELFYPEQGASQAEAKAVCRGCLVREDCLEWALVTCEKYGIWGGLSERQRRRLRKARAKQRMLRIIETDVELPAETRSA